MSTIPFPALPLETARAAESVFGRDHPYIQAGDALPTLWSGLDLSAVEVADHFLADSFYPYSLVTVLQYWEDLTDRQMAQATRIRLDLQYALHLPVHYPGIDALALCNFRQHILAQPAGRNALQVLLDGLAKFAAAGKAPAAVSRVLPAICMPSRAESILECISAAIEAIATRDPNWLRRHAQVHWYHRYGRRPDAHKVPRRPQDIRKLMQAVGRDGLHLLQAIETTDAAILARLPEIRALRREWERQFELGKDSPVFREFCFVCSNSSNSIIPEILEKEETHGDMNASGLESRGAARSGL